MLFSSLEFLYLFLPTVIIAYFLTPIRYKNVTLLATSIIFYAIGEPKYLPILLFCTAASYFFGRLMGDREGNARAKKRKILFAVSVALNLAILFFFKYFDFLLDSLALSPLGIFLPLGISFYIFQAISYLADVYLGRVRAQRSAVGFFTYITLFPQLVAGPIVRYSDIENELESRRHTLSGAADGVKLFCIGLSKKVLLANEAGKLWDSIVSSPEIYSSVLSAQLGIIFFSFQIYFDFSGYSDMARGLGRIFGFDFPKNFDYPYTSQSITEFWRRWHITLSAWFREYVYIPLGGNRRGRVRMYFNLLCVWLLTGLWHGAGLNFILWGLFFFAMLSAEKLGLLKTVARLPKILRHLYAFYFIRWGWIIFAFDGSADYLSASAGLKYFLRLFGVGTTLPHGEETYLFVRNIPFLLILCVAATPLAAKAAEKLRLAARDGTRGKEKRTFVIAKFSSAALAAISLLICTAYLVDSGYNPFLYFRF